jgi:predicted GIY-YIG superfamily endonuclease
MKISIYTLKDPITNKIRYVGQTNDTKRRLNRHLNNSRSFRDKRHISNWIRSLSYDPVMDIIETCEYAERNIRENYWIEYYKTQGFDLCNLSNGGAGAGIGNKNCVGRVMSEEAKQKISLANKGRKTIHGKGGAPGKKIYQYDLSGNLLNTFESIISASKTLNICRRTIKNSLNNKEIKRRRSPYKWSYEPLHSIVII